MKAPASIIPHPHYPVARLEGCESALLLFCAGFLGQNDGWHVANAGIENVVGVDVNAELLGQMMPLYPGWRFCVADAFQYARQAEREVRRFDLVSVDMPLSLAERTLEEIPLWCSLANRLVIVGALAPYPEELPLPAGWQLAEILARNDKAGWLVLEKV